MKRMATLLLSAMLCIVCMVSASADFILEPMGTFEFTTGIDGNFDEFSTDNPVGFEYESDGVMYFQCLCGKVHGEDTIVTDYEVSSTPDFKYAFTYTPGQRTWTENGKLDEGYTLVCTATDKPLAGEYPLTFRLKAKCGETGEEYWADCTIPVTVMGPGREDSDSGDASEWKEEYREHRKDFIWDLDYSHNRVYKLDDDSKVVWFIQKALKELGYYEGDITGHYGQITENAVKAFQRGQHLPVTGECDALTMARIFRLYLGNTGFTYASQFINPQWNAQTKSELANIGVRTGAVVKLVDLWTDLSLNIELGYIDGHIDAVPVSANDARILCRMYGASNSDELKEMIEMGQYPHQGRPMLLVVSHGGRDIQIVCSVNALPHGVSEMPENEYIGSFCIYLNGSVIHATDTTSSGHQRMIETAVRLMEEKKGSKISIGGIIDGSNPFDSMPPVEVPTLVMPDGAVTDANPLIKYDLSGGNGTIVYNVHMSNLEGEELELLSQCRLYFPYPEGMDENSADKYRIIIHHQIDEKHSEVFKSEDGDIEFTAQGLCICVDSFSPFEISWNAPTDGLPKTGDDSCAALWLCMLSLAGAGIFLLRRRAHN